MNLSDYKTWLPQLMMIVFWAGDLCYAIKRNGKSEKVSFISTSMEVLAEFLVLCAAGFFRS